MGTASGRVVEAAGYDHPYARGENIEGPRTYTTVDHPFRDRADRPLERIAVFEPDYVLIPNRVRDRLPESRIDGVVSAK